RRVFITLIDVEPEDSVNVDILTESTKEVTQSENSWSKQSNLDSVRSNGEGSACQIDQWELRTR
ncbi:hypothetical protein FRX31_034432, partial [Thalictrum thalictroides]